MPAINLRIGFVGRLEPYKGGELAIRAFAAATAGMDASLEIVGAGSQRALLESCAAQLGVSARVTFTGAVSQDEALTRIRSYDVVLIPSISTTSWKEQFGRIAAQAFEAGTPVIASDSGSLREVLAGCGDLFREGDVAELGDKLSRLLRDPARRAALSAQGRDERWRPCRGRPSPMAATKCTGRCLTLDPRSANDPGRQ